jgi:hypothetical protein
MLNFAINLLQYGNKCVCFLIPKNITLSNVSQLCDSFNCYCMWKITSTELKNTKRELLCLAKRRYYKETES